MRIAAVAGLILITSLFAAPTEAALWSSTNAVVPIGGTTTMSISLTGDQRTVAADLEIAIPAGIRVVSVTQRNGGSCALVARGRSVRVLVMDWNLLPLPAIAQPYCDLTLTAAAFAAPWFLMTRRACYDGFAAPTACLIDSGHLTITAR